MQKLAFSLWALRFTGRLLKLVGKAEALTWLIQFAFFNGNSGRIPLPAAPPEVAATGEASPVGHRTP